MRIGNRWIKVSFAERKVFVLGGEKSKMIKIQAIGE